LFSFFHTAKVWVIDVISLLRYILFPFFPFSFFLPFSPVCLHFFPFFFLFFTLQKSGSCHFTTAVHSFSLFSTFPFFFLFLSFSFPYLFSFFHTAKVWVIDVISLIPPWLPPYILSFLDFCITTRRLPVWMLLYFLVFFWFDPLPDQNWYFFGMNLFFFSALLLSWFPPVFLLQFSTDHPIFQLCICSTFLHCVCFKCFLKSSCLLCNQD